MKPELHEVLLIDGVHWYWPEVEDTDCWPHDPCSSDCHCAVDA